eukprot:4608038-Amphidinium_carterae.5
MAGWCGSRMSGLRERMSLPKIRSKVLPAERIATLCVLDAWLHKREPRVNISIKELTHSDAAVNSTVTADGNKMFARFIDGGSKDLHYFFGDADEIRTVQNARNDVWVRSHMASEGAMHRVAKPTYVHDVDRIWARPFLHRLEAVSDICSLSMGETFGARTLCIITIMHRMRATL